MGVKKDFTEATYNRLCALIKKNENEKSTFFDGIGDGFTDFWGPKEIDFAKYKKNLNKYYDNYVDQTNLSKDKLYSVFTSVNRIDETYAKRLSDENMDLNKLRRRILILSKYMNSGSGGAFTKNYKEIKKLLNEEFEKIDEDLYEYYTERYYTVGKDGKAHFNWDEISYALSKGKDEISQEELLALSSALFYMDGEDGAKALEKFVKYGYNKTNPKEWTHKLDENAIQTYNYTVGLSDTFKAVVELYNQQLGKMDYQTIRKFHDSKKKEDYDKYVYYQSLISNRGVLMNLVSHCSTITCSYDTFYVPDPLDKEHQPTPDESREVYVNYDKLPISIELIKDKEKLKVDYNAYKVSVKSKTSEYGNKETETKFDIYGMLNSDNFTESVLNSIEGTVDDELNGFHQDETTIDDYLKGKVDDKMKEKAIEKLCSKIPNAVPLVSEAVSIGETVYDNYQTSTFNDSIDQTIKENSRMFNDAIEINKLRQTFHMEIQVVKMNNRFYIENYYIDKQKVAEEIKKELGADAFTIDELTNYIKGKPNKDKSVDKKITDYINNHRTSLTGED